MLLEKRRTLAQRILRQIRIETHQSKRRKTDQSGVCNKARCKRVVVAVWRQLHPRDVCSCTSLSVFVYRVRALSAATPIYTTPVCAMRQSRGIYLDQSMQFAQVVTFVESGNQREKRSGWTQVRYLHPSRHTEVVIGRLRLRKCYLNAYLQQIEKHQDRLCNHCNKPETVSHFLTECSHSPTCLAVLAACKRLNLAPTLDVILSDGRLHNTIVSSLDRKL